MSESSRQLVPLIQRCIFDGRSGPWPELLSLAEDLIRSCFLSAGGQPSDLDAFADWLPGWIFEGRKLHALWRNLDGAIRTGRCATMEEREAITRNYLAKIIHSGRADFYRERHSAIAVCDPSNLTEIMEQDEFLFRSELNAWSRQIRQALLSLTPDLRIPFRLKYYAACGPLSEEEVAWISAQSGASPEDILGRVDSTFARNEGRTFPFSSAFVCELLGIDAPTDKAGKMIDQRICRVRSALRKQVNKPQGEER